MSTPEQRLQPYCYDPVTGDPAPNQPAISGGGSTPLVNNLTSSSTTSALTANMGKTLQDTKLDLVRNVTSTLAVPSGITTLGAFSGTVITPATAPNADGIAIQNWSYLETAGAQNWAGGVGHLLAGLSWYKHAGTGTVTLGIAGESKVENTSTGTITTAVGHETQLSTNTGIIGTLNLVNSRVTSNAGTIGTVNFVNVRVENNTGAITQVNGVFYPDLTAVPGITRKFLAYGLDPNAPLFNASVIVDGSSFIATPGATGFTATIPDRKAFAWISPAADYASGTVVLPAKANLLDGQRLRITFNKAVDAIAWTLSGVTAGLFLPGAAVAGMVVELTYNLATDFWICTSGASVQGRTILLGTNVTLSNTNAAYFDGAVIECSAALSITINAAARRDLGFVVIPPASGVVSIVSDGTVTYNGATTTITRNAAGNPVGFALIQRASNRNAYLVSGT